MATSNEWIPNELLLLHNGVAIFRVYRDDNHDEPREYSFGTAWDTCDHDDETNFDVRNLKTWHEPPHPPFISSTKDKGAIFKKKQKLWKHFHDSNVVEKAAKAAIIAAIDAGYLQEYIDAAIDRPKDVLPEVERGTAACFSDQLKQLSKEVDEKIEALHKQLPKGKGGRVMLHELSVDYSDGADYSIDGLIHRKGQGLLMIQSEDGGPDYDEQPLVSNIEVKIKVLAVLEQMAIRPIPAEVEAEVRQYTSNRIVLQDKPFGKYHQTVTRGKYCDHNQVRDIVQVYIHEAKNSKP